MVYHGQREVDSRLRHIMFTITKTHGKPPKNTDTGNLVVGANIAGFVKVADAMLDQGVVSSAGRWESDGWKLTCLFCESDFFVTAVGSRC